MNSHVEKRDFEIDDSGIERSVLDRYCEVAIGVVLAR